MSTTIPDHGAKRPLIRIGLYLVCTLYIVMGVIFASTNLDIDEFGVISEPYEMLGGDYTAGYIEQQRYPEAARTLLKSYYFYWKYRPLFAPIISPKDRELFRTEEQEFGYQIPESVSHGDRESEAKFEARLIVPEPERFYLQGAGKPLLGAILSIPQLALVQAIAPQNLFHYQYNYNYHPVFILTRVVQLLAGLLTILVVFRILSKECDAVTALLGAAIVAVFPLSIKYFPNLHHDSILVPFLILSTYSFYKRDYTWAGVHFGLALATKNVAVFLVPVFLAHMIWRVWANRENHDATERTEDSLARQSRGLLIAMVVAFFVLLPFADPVAYAAEILTPITDREIDQRSLLQVDQFTLVGELSNSGADSTYSIIRPEILLPRWLLRLQSNDFFLVAVGVFLFFSQRRSALAYMAFVFLLTSLPSGLVFGYDLNYRSLQYVPFFALLCAMLGSKRLLIAFVLLLLFLDVLYCIDPMNTDRLHIPVTN